MRLRLHGTPTENRAALAQLAKGFEIRTVSKPYPDRAPSALERIYVEADPRSPEDSHR